MDEFLPLRNRASLGFLLITQEVGVFWRRIVMKFFIGAGCPTGKKPFDFGADTDYDPDQGIINGIFTTVG